MANPEGIDVSGYQRDIDWQRVKAAGKSFAFARATQSTDFVDPRFHANWAGMQVAGIVRGAYHFFQAGVDPGAQARFFAHTVGPLAAADLPPVLDVEQEKGQPAPEGTAVKACLEEIRQLTGRTPIIYISPSNADAWLGPGFGEYPLWVADWSDQPRLPHGWSTWTFWQYSDKGRVDGVPTAVDLDYHNGPLGAAMATPPVVVPATQPATSTTPPATDAAPAAPAVELPAKLPATADTYTVQPGDTLWAIAVAKQTTAEAIALQNDIDDPNLISVGQHLKIPG